MEQLLDQLSSTLDGSRSGEFDSTSFKLPDMSISVNLEESHNSSGTNSTSSSWMSESSCGCHSPRSATYPPRSSLVFHKRSILPPLLCSAARVEMQVYRTKALEKERKKQRQKRSTLISRVEAILSSVDTDATSSSSREGSPRSSKPQGAGRVPVEAVKFSAQGAGLCSSQQHEENSGFMPEEIGDGDDLDRSEGSSSSPQEEAYRRSLHNLLQKSLTLDPSTTDVQPALLESMSAENMKKQSGQVSTPSSGDDVWAETSMATIIPNFPFSAQPDPVYEVSPLYEETLDKIAEELVNTVLENAKSQMVSQLEITTPQFDHKGKNMDAKMQEVQNDGLLSEIPCEVPLSSSSIDFPYYSPRSAEPLRQSTSPCKATEHINKALNLIEKKLLHTGSGSLSEDTQIVSLESISSNTSSPEFLCLRQPTSVTSSVTPETQSLLKSYRNALEAEEAERGTEDDLLSKAQRSCHPHTNQESQLTPSAFNLVQSEAIERVTSQLTSFDDAIQSNKDSAENVTCSGFPGLVRSNSYSLEAPSPFLISSRDAHTVYPINDDLSPGDVITTEVKRRLEMPSDSEESSVSTVPLSSAPSLLIKDNATMTDYCKRLEEQHKKEMMDLQSRHELQLAKFKEELLRGKSLMSDSLESSSVFEAIPACHESNFLSVYQPHSTNALTEQACAKVHRQWCKLSALIKGHLTRTLLSTRPVQATMQTIRDTSRTILSMRNEDSSMITNMSSIQDATLMNRLFSQLKAALYDFHAVFFETSVQERMEMISRSRSILTSSGMSKQGLTKNKHPRLSAATLKSLERKKSDRKNKAVSQNLNENGTKSKRTTTNSQAKQASSKISYMWKATEGTKKPNRTASRNAGRTPPRAGSKPKPWSPAGGNGLKKPSRTVYPRKILQRSITSNQPLAHVR